MKLEKKVRGLLCFFILVLLFVNLISFVRAQDGPYDNCLDTSTTDFVSLGYYECMKNGFTWTGAEIPAFDQIRFSIYQKWQSFAGNISERSDSLNKKIFNNAGWLIGTKNWEGEDVGLTLGLKNFNIYMLLAFILVFILLVLSFKGVIKYAQNNLVSDFLEPFKKLRNYFFGTIIGFVIYFLAIMLLTSYSATASFFSYFGFGVAVTVWIFLFFLITIFADIIRGTPNKNDWNLKSYYSCLFMLLIYPFLMQVPILNNILSVITLEPLFFFSEHSWWGAIIRSFIVAAVVYFIPLIGKSFKEYMIRKQKYKQKLEEAAIKEKNKIELRGR